MAAQFIKKPPPAGPSKTLKLIVFRDSSVSNRTLFPELLSKAEEILASQGNAFKLDVAVHPQDISYREEIYLITQLEEMVELARQATPIPGDRLTVLLVRARANLNLHGLAPKINGQRAVVIDTETPNPDRATLLHEMGHCAGLPHAGERGDGATGLIDVGGGDNVMAEPRAGVVRNTLTLTQGE